MMMMNSFLIAVLLISAPQNVVVYGADATTVQDLSAFLGPAHWNVQLAVVQLPARKSHPAEMLLKKGVEAYQDLAFEEAVPLFLTARKNYEATLIEPGEIGGYLHTLLYLALTYDGLGRAEETDAVIDDFVRLDADIAVLNEGFPPPFRIKIIERISGKAARGTDLQMQSNPPGAQIILNGKPRGKTPLTVPNVSYGTHTVTFSMPGYLSATQKVVIKAGGKADSKLGVDASLQANVSSVAQDALQSTAQNRLPDDTVTNSLQRAHLVGSKNFGVFIAITREQLTTAVLPSRGKWYGPEVYPSNALTVPPLRARMVEQLADWIRSHREPVAAEVKQAEIATPTRWWLWGTIGAVVLGGATAAAIAMQPEEAEKKKTGDTVIAW